MDKMNDTELELALKLNRHRVFMSRFVIFSLFFIDLLIAYNLWYRWVLYSSYTPTAMKEQLNPKLEIDFRGFHERHQPSSLTISQKGSLVSGQTLDHYVMIVNPNTDWQATSFTLEFRFPSETVRQTISNLLPSETRLAALYGFQKTSGVAFIASISNVEWKRVTYTIPRITSSLRIEQPRFESNGLVQDFGESVFTITNLSSRGFWNIPYVVKLYTGSQLAGITNLSLAKLDPEESRELRTAWNIDPDIVDRVEISIEPWSAIDPTNRYLFRELPPPSSGLGI